MDTRINKPSKRHLKLSLKKNQKIDTNAKRLNRSSDVIILDESYDKLRLEFPKTLQSKPLIYSPIVIDDSGDISMDEMLEMEAQKEPSKCGNVSFNRSRDSPSPTENVQPSFDGWSPVQKILTATPKNDPIPSTPKDKANESYEQCSIKKIEQSHNKLLSDLYGEKWKSIPKLFKTISHKYENFNGITKKLFDDVDGDKENIRHDLRKNKELYLTGSDVKRNLSNYGDSEKKSKKKLYTEKVPSTPDVTKQKTKVRNVNSTTKKLKIKKGMSVTELVNVMKNDIDDLKTAVSNVDLLMNKIESDITSSEEKTETKAKRNVKVDVLMKKIEDVCITPKKNVQRLSFMGSLADNVPSWRCHIEAIPYRDDFKTLKEQLTRRLFVEFNKEVFDNNLDADMLIIWDSKLRSTAGTTTNRLIKTSRGECIRTSSIKLSSKVVDAPARLRDTLAHELCHAATWLLDAQLRAGHGPLWKKWATRALQVFPELGEISRCHDLDIHFKYCYKCTKCGYSIQRHSKSIDITKKCCGYCRGTFQVYVNKKNKDGVVVVTPARKATANGFAQYVKENYSTMKDGTKTHAQVMKILGEQFSATKTK